MFGGPCNCKATQLLSILFDIFIIMNFFLIASYNYKYEMNDNSLCVTEKKPASLLNCLEEYFLWPLLPAGWLLRHDYCHIDRCHAIQTELCGLHNQCHSTAQPAAWNSFK